MPKVSVIVPVYNTEKYLEKCFSSLVNQTLDDIEIIIVNDGSPDNSQAVIDRYQAGYPDKITALYRENKGPGAARNLALEKAGGEYIGFCDSDDRVAPDMYEILYHEAVKNKSDVVICDIQNELENASTISLSEKERFYSGFPSPEGTAETVSNFVMYSTGAAFVCNKIIRKELFRGIQFIPSGYYEDVALTPIILSNCEKITYIRKALYYYLRRAGSITQQKDDRRNLGVIDAWKRCLTACNPKYAEEIAFAVYFSLCSFLDEKKAHMTDYVMFFIENNEYFRNNKYIDEAVRGSRLADLFSLFGKYIH